MVRASPIAAAGFVLLLLIAAGTRFLAHSTNPYNRNAKTMAAPATVPAYDEDNVFAKIIDGRLPCYKIFETEHALAFLDAFPVVEGHALLIPKAKGYQTIMDMPAEAAADFLKELPRLANAVKKATGAPGVNIVQNNGEAAGQIVFHTHFHVVPRTEGDNLVKVFFFGCISSQMRIFFLNLRNQLDQMFCIFVS